MKVRSRTRISYDAIFPTGHALAAQAEVSLKELAGLPLALPDKSFAARQAFDTLFADAGIELDPVFITSSLEMLKELVLGHAAATLLPALSVAREIRSGQMVAVPLSGKKGIHTQIDLCVAPDRQLSFAASSLPISSSVSCARRQRVGEFVSPRIVHPG